VSQIPRKPKAKRVRKRRPAAEAPPPAPPPAADAVDGGQEPEPKGLECPRCGCQHFHVLYIRRSWKALTRRRECRHCGKRITTRERLL
jgi:hypothetical protein